jgi:hypothetical protein
VADAHTAAGANHIGALPVTVAEALTEAAVTALAVHRAAGTPGDRVIAALVTRRVGELVLATVAELALDVPGWDPFTTLRHARRLLAGSDRWAETLAGGPLVASVAALLGDAAFPADRAADLHKALAQRCAAVAAGLTEEWAGPPDVLAAGLPLLGRPVADVALAVALANDLDVSDVAVRRFVYRRFGETTAEGLTGRHLDRSKELLAAFLRPNRVGASA